MKKLLPRQRVKRAIEHKDIDRIPLDLGSTTTTGIHYFALNNLKKLLDIEIDDNEIVSTYAQIAKVNEEVLKRLKIDTRFIQLKTSSNVKFYEGYFYDEWGIGLKKVIMTDGAVAYELNESPLREATIEDLNKYIWPDPFEKSRIYGLKEEAKELYQNTDYWICGTIGVMAAVFEIAHHLRGIDNFLIDLIANKKFAKTLLSIITNIQIKKYNYFLDAVGNNIDMVFFADDLATQTSLMISPELYREMIKPFHKMLIDAIKSKNDKVKVFYHCCGSASYLLKDFIENGIDVINPVQVTAKNMEPSKLKKEFDKKVCFWGGVDTQGLLRKGNEKEVRSEVRRLIEIFGKGSGYVLSAVHNILYDVPTKNIIAMYDEANKFSKY